MVMSDGQDPDVFINEIHHPRDELVETGEVINDDCQLDIVLEGRTDDYVQIKHNAEADDSLTLDKTMYTMPICMLFTLKKHGLRESRSGVNRPSNNFQFRESRSGVNRPS